MVTRDATVADIDRIDSMRLSDYAKDLSIRVPEHDGRLSEAELDQCVSEFVDRVR